MSITSRCVNALAFWLNPLPAQDNSAPQAARADCPFGDQQMRRVDLPALRRANRQRKRDSTRPRAVCRDLGPARRTRSIFGRPAFRGGFDMRMFGPDCGTTQSTSSAFRPALMQAAVGRQGHFSRRWRKDFLAFPCAACRLVLGATPAHRRTAGRR